MAAQGFGHRLFQRGGRLLRLSDLDQWWWGADREPHRSPQRRGRLSHLVLAAEQIHAGVGDLYLGLVLVHACLGAGLDPAQDERELLLWQPDLLLAKPLQALGAELLDIVVSDLKRKTAPRVSHSGLGPPNPGPGASHVEPGLSAVENGVAQRDPGHRSVVKGRLPPHVTENGAHVVHPASREGNAAGHAGSSSGSRRRDPRARSGKVALGHGDIAVVAVGDVNRFLQRQRPGRQRRVRGRHGRLSRSRTGRRSGCPRRWRSRRRSGWAIRWRRLLGRARTTPERRQ